MAQTLNPGNEPEFYISGDQLPHMHLTDVKLSPDGEYLSVTGANALSYIYRRTLTGQADGFYRLDWSCRHQRLAKSVMNFVGFGTNYSDNKFIIFPGNDNMIYQYKINNDDTITFCNAYDISEFAYECIHWLYVYYDANEDEAEDEAEDKFVNDKLFIFISGSRPINTKDALSPMAEFYSTINFKISNPLMLFETPTQVNCSNIPKIYSEKIQAFDDMLIITKHAYNNQHYEPTIETYHLSTNICEQRPVFQLIDSPSCVFYKRKGIHGSIDNLLYSERELQFRYNKKEFLPGHQINEVNAIGYKFVIHSTFIPTSDMVSQTNLHESECLTLCTIKKGEFTYEPIKKYKLSSIASQVQPKTMFIKFFTLDEKYTVVYEKIMGENTLRLGFILNVSGEQKQNVKRDRVNSVLIPYLPPELIDIVQAYL
jgi:hypothetical protein